MVMMMQVIMQNQIDTKVRVDKWLWAARFFKTRSMAAKAVSGGHVHLNGARVKAAKGVGIGDQLRINRSETEFTVIVLALSEKRGPASIAQTLYEETPESIAARDRKREEHRLFRMGNALAPAKRPGKRDRRLIRSFIRKRDK